MLSLLNQDQRLSGSYVTLMLWPRCLTHIIGTMSLLHHILLNMALFFHLITMEMSAQQITSPGAGHHPQGSFPADIHEVKQM